MHHKQPEMNAYLFDHGNFRFVSKVEPWVLADLCKIESVLWVNDQDVANEISGTSGEPRGEAVVTRLDLLEK